MLEPLQPCFSFFSLVRFLTAGNINTCIQPPVPVLFLICPALRLFYFVCVCFIISICGCPLATFFFFFHVSFEARLSRFTNIIPCSYPRMLPTRKQHFLVWMRMCEWKKKKKKNCDGGLTHHLSTLCHWLLGDAFPQSDLATLPVPCRRL